MLNIMFCPADSSECFAKHEIGQRCFRFGLQLKGAERQVMIADICNVPVIRAAFAGTDRCKCVSRLRAFGQ